MNIPILLYHSISENASAMYKPWAVSPSVFEEHLNYLSEHGYQPVTIKDIAKAIRSGGTGLPERPVSITFDDGVADFLTGAVPVLEKYSFPATLFVATGYVGQTSRWLAREGEGNRPMLTWEQIAALKRVELGAHSHSHFQMDLIPLSQAREEMITSKKLLEQHTGRSIDTFAFPHGYYTAKLLSTAQESGFSSACIVGHAMANHSNSVFALPRIIIVSNVSLPLLEQYLHGNRLQTKGAWRFFLRSSWRIVRKIKSR